MEEIFAKVFDELKKSVTNCKSNYLALSGGLDSSIIAYFLKERKLQAITIIAEDFIASDLTYCQLIGKHLKIPLKIQSVKIDKILESVEETIKILKNFNDIEIRNSIVMYLVLETVKKEGNDSIITGDGADELFAGYNFFLNKTPEELDTELKRIWKTMHFPSHEIGKALGINVESPFLNENIIELAKTVPVEYKVHKEEDTILGKWILRKIFEEKIPRSITKRQKSAMQDGSGTNGLTQLFDSVISDDIFEKKKEQIKNSDRVIIRSKESLHYYETYRKYYEPIKSDSSTKCPYCKFSILKDSKFCRMCGAFPI